MWTKTSDTDNRREYTNVTTGSKCATSKVYIDKDGNDWHSFDDLMTIPYTRSFAATKITALFALGLSKDDLNNHVNGLKQVLKSNDADKYEKAYAQVLDFENKANNATDAIKQMSGLVCVYFLIGDELIDSFDNNLQIKKMAILEADPAMHSFFLRTQITLIEEYTRRLGVLSAIASPMSGGQGVHSI